jgi:enediyne biosynthesis protein E4
LMFDADNDALTDIYVCNGINHDLTNQDFINFFADDVIQRMAITGQKEEIESIIDKMPQQKIPNNFFHNKGQLKFDDAANQFGFADSSFSNGAAYADLDNDGDLDLVVNNVNQECFVYKNHSQERNGHHFLSVQLKGESKNSFAIGAKIKLFIGRQQLSREVIPSRGFQSSVDYKQVIGIGKDSLVDSLQVIWPDLSTTTIVRPTIDTLLLIDAATAKGQWQNMAMQSDKAYLFETASGFDLHTEDSGYVDFYTERLVPVLLSHEGPKAAVADVDGDGLQDVYIGGAADVAGALYLQKAGKWLKKEAAVFKMYADLEDVAALFFDADKDGDQDLYVGAGGNFVPIFSSREYLHRLYINDGKGNFELQQNGFPVNETNVGAVAANDIDGDGDIDLFIGGRSVPQQYGSSPRSYIMINDGKGHFTDATKTICPALQYPGMVTAAKWVNLLGDAQPELLVVGEWMAPLMLTKKDQQLVEAPHNLADKFGWWQCVETADMDGDGDKDLIIGNIGENFYLKPDSLHPAKLFLNDFDGNGTADKIITRSWNGKDVPVFMKRELEEQMPFLKKQNLTFQNFGFAGVQDLFTQEVMRKTGTKQFNYGASIIAFNNGNGQFSWQKLPAAVQFSSVRAIRSQDMNGDGKMDLLLGGNHFGFLPQFCRLDASNGDLLLNDGKGNLTSSGKGLGWDGELRDLHWLTVNDKQCLLVLQNQRKPILYEWRK